MHKKGRTAVRIWNKYGCPAVEYTVMGVGIGLLIAGIYVFNAALILALG